MDALRRAQWLDDELGDPHDPRGEFSYARRVEEDEAERYPSGALRTLLAAQLHRRYVPRELGGDFHSFEEVGALVRVVARRDLTVAITHAISLLGTAVVWLGGDAAQQRALASSVLEGERVSVALTEPGSGSDLLAMSVAAQPSGEGYHLTGEKWLGNGLDRHRFVVVYARTEERGGPRGFSHFLVDKQAVSDSGVRASGKIPTLGLRGADLNGLHFDAQLPASARIGAAGSGFEVILKALQVSRTICGTLSLGALDTALDTVLRFALNRRIYGKQVAELPQSQKLLVESWAELLVCDSLTGLALRALHAVPQQASVHSAVVKYLVPTLAEHAMQKLSVVYGARYYLRNGDDPGIFQKMYRDNLVVSLFDGSTQVNLFSLSHQLRSLITHARSTEIPAWASGTEDPIALDWSKLTLSASGQDAILAGFDAGCRVVRGAGERESADIKRGLQISLDRLIQGRDELFEGVRQLSPGAFAAGDPEAFELARRYAVIIAASAVLADWHLNQPALTGTLANPAVLTVVLHRLAAQLGGVPLLPSSCYRDCFAALIARRERDGQCGLYNTQIENPNSLS
jgi:alkylation response protein AidB-like acyl-CoA dehydrogenase